MCDACNSLFHCYTIDRYMVHRTIGINNSPTRFRIYDTENNTYICLDNISFCPWCGEKLIKEGTPLNKLSGLSNWDISIISKYTGITTIEELSKRSSDELLKYKGIGNSTVSKIEHALDNYWR